MATAAEHTRAYRERHPERVLASKKAWRAKNPDLVRASNLRHHYSMTSNQYDEMLAAQGGVCASCGNPETKKNSAGTVWSLSVDHDHSCCPGKRSCGQCIRGLLCSDCNRALGLLKDSIERAEALASYLRRFKG